MIKNALSRLVIVLLGFWFACRFAPAALASYTSSSIEFVCAQNDTNEQPTLSAQSFEGAIGEQKVAVLLVNFDDDLRRPFSTADIHSRFFDTVNAFIKESSYDQTWLTGRVFDWLTLPHAAKSDTNAIASEADRAAAAAGLDLSLYSRKVYIFPTQNFPWAGLGTIGGSRSKAWINGDPSVRILAHELGHNFGLRHANALVFPGVSFDASKPGINLDQGDRYDAMGKFGVSHFNAKEKEYLGWLSVEAVTHSGTYEIYPIELSTQKNRGLKVQTPSGRQYYLEYRMNSGFDQFFHPNVTNGVLIHLAGMQSMILDMTPDTFSLDDPALPLGRSYTDPDGITFSVIKKQSGSMLVNIQMNPADQPPLVNAGADQTVTLPLTVQLGGRVSLAANQHSAAAVTTAWSLIEGPGPVVFDDSSSRFTEARFYKAGTYTLQLVANDGRFLSSDEVSIVVHTEPASNALGAIQNPFNLNSGRPIQITYKVEQESSVTLDIYNVLGEKITTLDNSFRTPGVYTISWDGRNSSGSLVAAEVYLVRLVIGDHSQIQKVVVVR